VDILFNLVVIIINSVAIAFGPGPALVPPPPEHVPAIEPAWEPTPAPILAE
jgi:hypothetical protein